MHAWSSWARRCRLQAFKKLALTIKAHFEAGVRGMLDRRSAASYFSPITHIGVKRRQARGEADQASTVMVCQSGQLSVGDLPVPEHAAPGNVGISEAVGQKAVPRAP